MSFIAWLLGREKPDVEVMTGLLVSDLVASNFKQLKVLRKQFPDLEIYFDDMSGCYHFVAKYKKTGHWFVFDGVDPTGCYNLVRERCNKEGQVKKASHRYDKLVSTQPYGDVYGDVNKEGS